MKNVTVKWKVNTVGAVLLGGSLDCSISGRLVAWLLDCLLGLDVGG